MRHIDLDLNHIPEGRPIRVEEGRLGIVLIRQGDRITAFEDACPHAQWRLSDGELIDGRLECPGHGWEFSPHSGQCITVPAYCLKAVPIVRNGSSIRLLIDTSTPETVPTTVDAHGQAYV
jgi:nitrite reductase/ring-hydroxylating ferredoxin subunit